MSIGLVDIDTLFDFELAPFPTSLCNQSGSPRYTTSKSDLKNLLKVSVSSRNVIFDSIIIDGNAMDILESHWIELNDGEQINSIALLKEK